MFEVIYSVLRSATGDAPDVRESMGVISGMVFAAAVRVSWIVHASTLESIN